MDVVALTVADRAAPEELARHLAQQVPHFRSRSVPPSACRTFQVVDEEEAEGLPRRFLVDGLQLLLGQQGRELLQHGFQLQLVAEAPDAHELHVHPHGGADEPELLGGDPGRDLHVAAADEERVQGPVAGAAVELRLIREVVDHDQDLVELFEA